MVQRLRGLSLVCQIAFTYVAIYSTLVHFSYPLPGEDSASPCVTRRSRPDKL